MVLAQGLNSDLANIFLHLQYSIFSDLTGILHDSWYILTVFCRDKAFNYLSGFLIEINYIVTIDVISIKASL